MIGQEAFTLSGLESVVIPEGVTEIGQEAFRSSGLESITIPKEVVKIRSDAFKCCPLKKVYYHGSPDEWSRIDMYQSDKRELNDKLVFV